MEMHMTFMIGVSYPTHYFCWWGKGDTISSFDTGYHVMSLWLCNLGGIKVAQPRAHHMISNIEGVHRVSMGDVTCGGCKSYVCI